MRKPARTTPATLAKKGPYQSFGTAPPSSRGLPVEIRPGAQEPLSEQPRRARPPGHQGSLPAHARLQVVPDGGRDPRGPRTRASDPQAPVQIWSGLVEPLVGERTVGPSNCVSAEVQVFLAQMRMQ